MSYKTLPYVIKDGKKYTVDERLGEYRIVDRDKQGKLRIQFIKFESVKGKQLSKLKRVL